MSLRIRHATIGKIPLAVGYFKTKVVLQISILACVCKYKCRILEFKSKHGYFVPLYRAALAIAGLYRE